MTTARVKPSAPGLGRIELRLPSSTWVLFASAVAVMMLAWLLLALIYSGIGGGQNIADARRVISSVTSTQVSSGSFDVQGIVATPEYFTVTDRADEFFSLAPEENLATLTTSPGAFDALDESAEALGIDPGRTLPVLLVVGLHDADLPDPGYWASVATVSVNGQELPPAEAYSVAFQSDHHQTIALQFPRTDAAGNVIVDDAEGTLSLSVPNIDAGSGELTTTWPLPLEGPKASDAGGVFPGSVATLGALLAVMAGLLVVFSPCVVHMTAIFLPVITGLGMKEIKARKSDVRFRAHVALSGIAFVGGFVVLYTAFGVAAGFAGQFFSNTAQLESYLTPIRLVTGTVVIFLALQTLGLFRLPFIMSLQLPGSPHKEDTPRQGYLAAAIAGMSVSFGCLVCVGGTILASLIIYAGASSSPLVGGLTLFLFSIGMSIPFLLVAFAFDKMLPRIKAAWSLVRYSSAVAGAVMLVVGLLILSGNESVFERLVL
jgi:cytochrome c-type biogenesis protein